MRGPGYIQHHLAGCVGQRAMNTVEVAACMAKHHVAGGKTPSLRHLVHLGRFGTFVLG